MKSISAVVLAACVALPTTSAAQTTAKRPAVKPAVKAPESDPQPRLVAVDVQKCIGCQTTVRKRIGVMPVKVGVVSPELGLAGNIVGDKVRDALEASVARARGLLVVNRSDLADVLAEQRLAVSGAANEALAPAPRAIIPAQILLYATVDRANVSVKTEKQSNNTAAGYYQQALAKEQEAALQDERAREAAAALQHDAAEASKPSFGEMLDVSIDCSNQRLPFLVQSCEQQKRLNQMTRDRMRAGRARAEQDHLTEAQNAAQSLRAEAEMLRRRADIESRRDVSETRTTSLDLMVTWRAIDTATSAVVASGAASGNRVSRDQGKSSQSAFQGSETTSSARYDALVNDAVGDAIAGIGPAVSSKLASVPFRAKVASVDAEGVIINAGANLGVGVGDTFGVRQRTAAVTDPDTGELLTSPGPPAGLIRVIEVFDRTARAQLVKQAGDIKRGDELEWIGMFTVAAAPGGATSGR